MRRAFSRRGRNRRESRRNTVARLVAARTARSASSSYTPVPKGRPSLIAKLYLPAEWTEDPRALPRGGHSRGGRLCHQRGVGPADAGTRLCGGGEGRVGGGRYDLWLRRGAHLAGGAAAALCARGGRDAPGLERGCAQTAGPVAVRLPEEAWVPLSAGEGSQGPRLYRWAWLEVADAEPEGARRGGARGS